MCMTKRFCTGISKRKIFSFHPRAISRLGISVLPESYNTLMTAPILPLELHTIFRLKSARKNPTIKNLIFGVWAASFMKSQHLIMHLMLKTWRALCKKFWKELTLLCQRFTVRIWKNFCPKCWLRTQTNVHQYEKSWKCHSWRPKSINCFLVPSKFMSWNCKKKAHWTDLTYLETSKTKSHHCNLKSHQEIHEKKHQWPLEAQICSKRSKKTADKKKLNWFQRTIQE